LPIAAGVILRPGRAGSDDDVALLRWIKARYAPVLDRCLRHPRIVALGTLLVAGPALALALLIGSDFMPQLDEGAFLLQTILPPEASLEEVDRLNHRVEDILRQVPEVEDVVRRTGRAEQVMRAHGKPYTSPKHDLFPIPQAEIDLSGGRLIQNPGY